MPSCRYIAPVAVVMALAVLSCRSVPATGIPFDADRDVRERGEMATGSPEDPEARDRWFWQQRAYPAGTIPFEAHRRALFAEIANRRVLAAGDEAWTSLGPAPLIDIVYNPGSTQNASGRALTLAIHPADPDTMLIGTAEGGIWKSTDRGATWRSVGEQSLPTLVVSVIRYSPADPNLVYAGTGEPNGAGPIHGFGLARSTDGGETWELLPGRGSGWDFHFTSITGLHFDADDGTTLYVTTATVVPRGLLSIVPPDLPQTGFFKSTDGGQSWQMLRAARRHTVASSVSAGFVDFEYGGVAAPDVMYVSEYYGGILRSNDAGATWRYVTPLKPNGLGTFPGAASPVSYTNGAGRYSLGTRLPNPDTDPDFRLIEIALAPSNPQILYAGFDAPGLRIDINGDGVSDRRVTTALLFKSVDGGETWRWLGTRHDGIPDYCGFQCWYDNVISVHPANPDDVILGGSANYQRYTGEPFANPKRLVEMPWRGMLYRSLDGGKSWVDMTPHCTALSTTPARIEGGLPVYPCASIHPSKVTHPDVHAIVRGPNDTIYVASDGGIYRGSLPNGPGSGGKRRAVAGQRPPALLAGLVYTWENLNEGLSTLQFYRIAAHPTDPDVLLGGLQDNTAGYWNGHEWQGWGNNDGTIAFFDPVDPRHVYLGTQFEVHRHDDGGTKEFSTAAGWKMSVFAGEEFDFNAGETTSFLPVFALDPVEPSITYGASDRALYRSTERGAHSVRIGPATSTTGIPTSVAVSPVDHHIVWMGTGTGSVYRYDVAADGTAAGQRVDSGLPNRSVSRVVPGYDSADTIYAVFNGYDLNTPGSPGKVFVSRDRGVTWQNISGNLPDVPATSLALDPADPNRLWVSTDSAVYSTRDGGGSWQSERRNMPVVTINDLAYNAKTGYLVAATFGRGVWKIKVGDPAPK